ncbi:lytic murein transglycosylase [Mesorhizobium sp. B2-4-19]|nr:lytic murein transglycosylase [Mesorhizobium sp. B2-4-19]
MLRLNTPLWPAGHLPLKGGDWMPSTVSQIATVEEWAMRLTLPISPLEGETPGRAERGALAPASPVLARQETFQ